MNKTVILSSTKPASYVLATAAKGLRVVALCSADFERGQSRHSVLSYIQTIWVSNSSRQKHRAMIDTQRLKKALCLVSCVPTSVPSEDSLLLDRVKKGTCRYSVDTTLAASMLTSCFFVFLSLVLINSSYIRGSSYDLLKVRAGQKHMSSSMHMPVCVHVPVHRVSGPQMPLLGSVTLSL